MTCSQSTGCALLIAEGSLFVSACRASRRVDPCACALARRRFGRPLRFLIDDRTQSSHRLSRRARPPAPHIAVNAIWWVLSVPLEKTGRNLRHQHAPPRAAPQQAAIGPALFSSSLASRGDGGHADGLAHCLAQRLRGFGTGLGGGQLPRAAAAQQRGGCGGRHDSRGCGVCSICSVCSGCGRQQQHLLVVGGIAQDEVIARGCRPRRGRYATAA
jgi:hypothetical protein